MEAIPGHPVQRHPQQRITAPPSALPGVVVVLQPDTREPGPDWAAAASPGTHVVAVDGVDDGDNHDDDDDDDDGDEERGRTIRTNGKERMKKKERIHTYVHACVCHTVVSRVLNEQEAL